MKIIGIGNKARQGKDTIAEMFCQQLKNAYVFHWADELYAECQNKSRQVPLIKLDDKYVSLLADDEKKAYHVFEHRNMPKFVDFMRNKDLKEYMGMDEKDSPLLQIWGTEFRRMHCGLNYWIKRTLININRQDDEHDVDYAFIADTRYLNEHETVKKYGGLYINIQRFREDGSRWIDESRDPNHPGEVELDNIYADVVIRNDKTLDELRARTTELIPVII